MTPSERSRPGLVAIALVLAVVALRLTWPHWGLDLPGEKPIPARWDPDLAVRNGFNEHQQELGTAVRMTRADCDEMSTSKGAVGCCVIHLDDGTTDVLTLTMLQTGGDFDIQVADDVAR